MSLPVVAIIGRPNVGKSSLFNRLIRRKLAVVDSISGVTRDRIFSRCEWSGRDYYVVDTGGMVPGSKDAMERLILEQATIAVDEADLIIFLVDCQTGITDIDERIARQLHRTQKPVLLAVNKADGEPQELSSSVFFRLGFDPIYPVSAANGRGVGELLDAVNALLPEAVEAAIDENVIRVAVVGRPNVGKSSFVNQLLGVARHIVSEIPGTTRDAVDSPLTLNGRNYILVDTAGLRRRAKVTENLEYYTSLRTLRAIQRCDVAVVLFDAQEGLNLQELKIIEEVSEAGRGMVLAVNKWDIFEKDEHTADIYTRQLHEAMPVFDHLPIIFTSALTGQRVAKTLQLVDGVFAEFTKRISTPVLNRFLEAAVERQSPPAAKGKWIKLLYMTQPDTAPPRFVIFCNHPRLIEPPYLRYLTNRLREEFGFAGCPIEIKLKLRRSA